MNFNVISTLGAAVLLVGVFILFVAQQVFSIYFGDNVRELIKEKAWNRHFVRLLEVATSPKFRNRGWISLIFGLIGGVGVAILVATSGLLSLEPVDRWMPGIEAAEEFGPADLVQAWSKGDGDGVRSLTHYLEQQLRDGKLVARGRVLGLIQDVPTVLSRVQWQYLTFGDIHFTVAHSHNANIPSYYDLEFGKAKGR
jgi:hypothetical protein